MKNIVFQGDSITDFGRNYADPYNVGAGYVLFIQAILKSQIPRSISAITAAATAIGSVTCMPGTDRRHLLKNRM